LAQDGSLKPKHTLPGVRAGGRITSPRGARELCQTLKQSWKKCDSYSDNSELSRSRHKKEGWTMEGALQDIRMAVEALRYE
jgi:hypothetical protein